MTRSLRRIMNPIEWGKPIYGLFEGILGARGAWLSLYLVTFFASLAIVGLLLYSYWSSVADSYRKDHPVAAIDYGQLHLDALRQLNAERKAGPKQTVSYAYRPEITFDCPENVSLRIFPRDNAVIAVFTKNGITATAGPYRLETRDYRTFSLADRNWREPKVFMAPIASVPILEPGHPSKDFVLILVHTNQLEIGNRSMNEILVWPPADPSPIHRYLLRLVVFGSGDAAKTIQICIRWERGTGKIGLLEYNEKIPASAV